MCKGPEVGRSLGHLKIRQESLCLESICEKESTQDLVTGRVLGWVKCGLRAFLSTLDFILRHLGSHYGYSWGWVGGRGM